MRAPPRTLAFALAALLAAACTEGLDRRSSVHDLRILAISVDPPDYVVPADYDPRTSPLPRLPIFNIKVLFGDDPATPRPLSWRVTICAEPDSLRCEGADGGLDGAFVLGEGTSDAVGGLAEAQLKLGTTDQYVAGLSPIILKAIEVDRYKGFGGMPLVISVKVMAGAEEAIGGKRIPLWLPIPKPYPEIQPNQLPPEPIVLFDGVAALPGDVPEVFGPELGMDLFPEDPAAYERYVVPTFDGTTKQLKEAWAHSWYTTKGWFSPDTTGGWNPILEEPGPTAARLQVPASAEPGPFKIVVVTRDGRGGEVYRIVEATYRGQ